MARTKAEARITKEFRNAILRYRVSEEPEDAERNAESLEKFRQVLGKAGIHLDLRDGVMRMYLDPVEYTRTQTRYAGGKDKRTTDRALLETTGDDTVRYADVAGMILIDHMQDLEIMKTLGMSRSTFYRHKKTMTESVFWRMIERDGLKEVSQLRALPFNLPF